MPGCDTPTASSLPSADSSGHPLLGPHVEIDFLDFNALATDPMADTYFEASGFIDPDRMTSVDPSDDCGDLDLFDDTSSQGSDSSLDPPDAPTHLLPSHLPHSNDDFLTACLLTVDPIVHALHGLDPKLHSMNLSCSHFYLQLGCSDLALGWFSYCDGVTAGPSSCTHIDGGSMATTCPIHE